MRETVMTNSNQTAARLGVSLAWLVREADAGRLPFIQVGPSRMFILDDVVQAIQIIAHKQAKERRGHKVTTRTKQSGKSYATNNDRYEFVKQWIKTNRIDTRDDAIGCAKAMKDAGLYSKTTYIGDIQGSVWSKVRNGIE